MKYLWLTGLSIALITNLASATTFTDIVLRVSDGDTFRIKSTWKGLTLSIRVLGIDTPEHRPQAQCSEEAELADRATDYAQALLVQSGNRVRINVKGWDKYGGRVLAQVSLEIAGKKVDYAEEMIKAGFAREYSGEAKGRYWCDRLQAE